MPGEIIACMFGLKIVSCRIGFSPTHRQGREKKKKQEEEEEPR
jgi:hypothetical protein